MITADVVTSVPAQQAGRCWDGWAIWLSAAAGLACCLVLRAHLADADARSLQACLAQGTNPLYCRNTEEYPAIFQWTYAVLAGWVAFFGLWIAYTLYPWVWQRLL